MYAIEQISWEEILDIWKNHLWPNRTTPIEPTSSMKYLGGYDRKIKENPPCFIGARQGGRIIGVNSIFRTGKTEARSRGIWVNPNHRKSGVGLKIMAMCIRTIIEKEGEDIETVWSAPRKTALDFYLRCGFVQTSDFTDDGFEFGPNCYVSMDIRKNHARIYQE